jgi:alpha-glucosidase (family GH31 glycosyl hydrolase)
MAMMTAEEAAEWGKTLSFEKVWAMFAETDRKMEETERQWKESMRKHEDSLRKHEASLLKHEEHEEFIRELKEYTRELKESNRAQRESLAKMEKKTDNIGKNVGGLNSSLGQLIETLVEARLWEKFPPEYNLVRSYRRIPIYDKTNRARTDIDILLSNTNKAVAVEVKHELDKEKYVAEHIRRMELIRTYPPAEVVGKELFGAMAGIIVTPDVVSSAYNAGFWVFESTGDTVSLIPPPDGFKPGKW